MIQTDHSEVTVAVNSTHPGTTSGANRVVPSQYAVQAAIELALANVEVATTRVEDYAPAAPFDVVVSRAYSDLASFAAAGLPRLAPGGTLVAMKGALPHEELAQLPPEVRVVATPALLVPGLAAERHLVIMERA